MARHLTLLCCLLACLHVAACSDNAVIPDEPNRRPVADARIRVDGKALDEKVVGGAEALMVPLAAGADSVEVTLDASQSSDQDGRVVSYRWLSATSVPDGGIGALSYMGASGVVSAGGRFVPGTEPGDKPGARKGTADWPEDVERPVVELGEGAWSFSLWVTDDDGATSTPDTITILVGGAGGGDAGAGGGGGGEVEACVAEVLASVPEECSRCLCGIESCRATVVESACNEDCWGLIECISTMCPDYAEMAAMGDTSCVTGNCAAFLTAETAAAARPVGTCVRDSCAEACASM